jgi:hypothetical protein
MSYSLQDDYDIKVPHCSSHQSVWSPDQILVQPAYDTYSKYLIFRAIPMNLLLWGCKAWSLPYDSSRVMMTQWTTMQQNS